MTGTVVCTIGCGLITTIGVGTRTTIWATYEAIIGIGLGASLQLPYTALQLVLRYIVHFACLRPKVNFV